MLLRKYDVKVRGGAALIPLRHYAAEPNHLPPVAMPLSKQVPLESEEGGDIESGDEEEEEAPPANKVHMSHKSCREHHTWITQERFI